MDQGNYLGMVSLGQALRSSFVTTDTSGTPTDGDSAPSYRVYGKTGLMNSATGSLSLKDPSSTGGTITGATNATPIVVTSAAHGLTVGTRVTISGVLGNTAANGTFVLTAADANTFTLGSSVGNGNYTSGGTFHVSGLYDVNFTPLGANGFIAGENYAILVSYAVSSVSKGLVLTFSVV